MKREDEIRKELLFQLYADRTLPRSAEMLARECRKQRLDFFEKEIRAELIYLADEGLITEVLMAGTGQRFYRLTSKGVNYYQENFAA
jgi:hypothetical protein